MTNDTKLKVLCKHCSYVKEYNAKNEEKCVQSEHSFILYVDMDWSGLFK